LPIKAEFYVFGDRLLKTLTYEKPRLMKGRIIPTSLIMQNAFTQDYITTLELEDINFEPIKERIFTEEYLKKGR